MIQQFQPYSKSRFRTHCCERLILTSRSVRLSSARIPKESCRVIIHWRVVCSHQQEISQALCCYFLHVTLFKIAFASTRNNVCRLKHLFLTSEGDHNGEQDLNVSACNIWRFTVLPKFFHTIQDPHTCINSTVQAS